MQRYYVLNALAILSYAVVRYFKTSPALKTRDEWLGVTKESNVMMLLCILLVSKYKASTTLDEFAGKVVMFGKAAVLFMLWSIDGRLMIWYLVLFFALFVMCKSPRYTGPHKIVTCNPTTLAAHLSGKAGVSWLVHLKASWCETCVNIEPTYAELSLRYDSPGLRFAEVDVERWGELAEKYKIDVTSKSWQLPTFILFTNGREEKRLPVLDSKGVVKKTKIDKMGLIAYFELDSRMLAAN